jgi:hypothetical protein
VSPVVDGKAARVRFETRDDGSKVRLGVARDDKGKMTEKVLGEIRSAEASK